MDVLAGRQIHHRVAAPADRPGHLFHFLANARTDRGIADVGVDLNQEIAADGHRLHFGVVDVGRNDGAAARDLVSHELGGDGGRNGRAERLARVLAQQALDHLLAVGTAVAQRLQIVLAAQALADRHVLHFRRDDAPARVMHLRDIGAGRGAARRPLQVKAHRRQLGIGQAFLAVVAGRARQHFRIAALLDPRAAQFGQAATDIDSYLGVGVGAAAVIDGQWRILFPAEHRRRIVLLDLPERHADVGARADFIHAAGFGQRCDGRRVDFGGSGQEFGIGVHGKLQASGWSRSGMDFPQACSDARRKYGSQHRHYPYWYEGTLSTRRRPESGTSTPARKRSIEPQLTGIPMAGFWAGSWPDHVLIMARCEGRAGSWGTAQGRARITALHLDSDWTDGVMQVRYTFCYTPRVQS
ncbi:hypothetical protein D3C85_887290 [compost metagenome]